MPPSVTNNNTGEEASSQPGLRLAIIDDYDGLAKPYFDRLSDGMEITTFSDTLDQSDPVQMAELIERLKPYHIISTVQERTPFSRHLLRKLPNLELLITSGGTTSIIDLEASTDAGITVAGTAGNELLDLAAQHVWNLILGIAGNIIIDDSLLNSLGWVDPTTPSLSGKTLGILGFNDLSVKVAKIGALGFNMKIIIWSENLIQSTADAEASKVGLSHGAFAIAESPDDLFCTADVVSVHFAPISRYEGLVGYERLSLMKDSALLIDASGGYSVDDGALLDILKERKIKGAALDASLPPDSDWCTTTWGAHRSEVLLSSNMAIIEKDLIRFSYMEQVKNVEKWLDGWAVIPVNMKVHKPDKSLMPWYEETDEIFEKWLQGEDKNTEPHEKWGSVNGYYSWHEQQDEDDEPWTEEEKRTEWLGSDPSYSGGWC
ncbi:hypothetical protein LOZ53_002440 [Ophidiomyces ophidiicola]|nr:hypothetical protein LOZ55_003486 [Ophidiomyces ophidiicola]KAI1992508.1 hypothetical protein LOZ53_002440 [Ophidiomyces ophidiicola]KAI1993430.1 hypothetical protein LOZ54_001350 [Ophidiomyces ophidiicola]KAI1997031.1 hypothetical protein LOZ51_003194 [Ophidiomyces ophidiicola]